MKKNKTKQAGAGSNLTWKGKKKAGPRFSKRASKQAWRVNMATWAKDENKHWHMKEWCKSDYSLCQHLSAPKSNPPPLYVQSVRSLTLFPCQDGVTVWVSLQRLAAVFFSTLIGGSALTDTSPGLLTSWIPTWSRTHVNEISAAPSVSQRRASALRACQRHHLSLNTLLTQVSSDGALNDPVPRPGPAPSTSQVWITLWVFVELTWIPAKGRRPDKDSGTVYFGFISGFRDTLNI